MYIKLSIVSILNITKTNQNNKKNHLKNCVFLNDLVCFKYYKNVLIFISFNIPKFEIFCV